MFVRADGVEDPDGGVASDTDLDLYHSTAYRHAGGISLSQNIGSRSAIHLNYNIRFIDFTEDSQDDFRTEAAAVGFSYRMNSHMSLRLGYGRRWSDDYDDVKEVFNLDVGLDYSKAVSLSRRTRLAFSTGSAISASDRLESDADPRLRFHLIGAARLVHELGRTWTAGASYRRSLNFREGFDEPLMADAVTGTIGGLITRQLDFSVNVGYVNAVGVENQRTGYDAFTVNSQLQYALTRYLAMFARYFYYDYTFDARSALEQGIRPNGSETAFGSASLLRSRSFDRSDEKVIPGKSYKPEDFVQMAWRRKWLIAIPPVVFGIAVTLWARTLPNRYQSDVNILVVPPRVSEKIVDQDMNTTLRERLESMKQRLLSRSNLERIIHELNLYPEERKTLLMEQIVETMNRDANVTVVKGKGRRKRTEQLPRRVRLRESADGDAGRGSAGVALRQREPPGPRAVRRLEQRVPQVTG